MLCIEYDKDFILKRKNQEIIVNYTNLGMDLYDAVDWKIGDIIPYMNKNGIIIGTNYKLYFYENHDFNNKTINESNLYEFVNNFYKNTNIKTDNLNNNKLNIDFNNLNNNIQYSEFNLDFNNMDDLIKSSEFNEISKNNYNLIFEFFITPNKENIKVDYFSEDKELDLIINQKLICFNLNKLINEELNKIKQYYNNGILSIDIFKK